ncbi:hypothetical protein E2C01_092350 [Portunus trituberculatus]|uniref:Uncharacterized protein n=1 Tax=Portunus trituberculatus TaxID=210409 RepID=A0A5B7JLJ6_PORTR|nr:hypothetical protein [Portunus trituberculatus]
MVLRRGREGRGGAERSGAGRGGWRRQCQLGRREVVTCSTSLRPPATHAPLTTHYHLTCVPGLPAMHPSPHGGR